MSLLATGAFNHKLLSYVRSASPHNLCITRFSVVIKIQSAFTGPQAKSVEGPLQLRATSTTTTHVSMGTVQVNLTLTNLNLAGSLAFFLHRFHKENLGIRGTGFYGLDSPPVTKQHQRNEENWKSWPQPITRCHTFFICHQTPKTKGHCWLYCDSLNTWNISGGKSTKAPLIPYYTVKEQATFASNYDCPLDFFGEVWLEWYLLF